MGTDVTARVDRLLTVRSHGGDCESALQELRELPGIESVCMDRVTGAFNVVFDARVVSDDELAAALAHHAFEVVGWQQARIMTAEQQRLWLMEQLRDVSSRAPAEHLQRGEYAEGVMKGAADAYARTARAFGLVTDEEVRALIPAHSLGCVWSRAEAG